MSDKTHGKQFSTTMTKNLQEQLLIQQTECTFVWQGKAEAMATVMSYLWADGCIWLTTNDARPRVDAVRKNGRATIVVSSAGTSLGLSRCITLRGQCAVLEDRQSKDWFYPLFCKKLFPENLRAQVAMQGMLDREGQIILQLKPDNVMGYDGDSLMRKMAAL